MVEIDVAVDVAVVARKVAVADAQHAAAVIDGIGMEDARAETGDGAAAAGQDSAGGEQVAMIAPDPVTIVKSAPSGPNGMPLADFLKSYEGEQCIQRIEN